MTTKRKPTQAQVHGAQLDRLNAQLKLLQSKLKQARSDEIAACDLAKEWRDGYWSMHRRLQDQIADAERLKNRTVRQLVADLWRKLWAK